MNRKHSVFLNICAFSLIFSIDSAVQGIAVGLWILIFYPLFVVLCGSIRKFKPIERAYSLVLFTSTLTMGAYLSFTCTLSEEICTGLLLKAPASMAMVPFLALGFSSSPSGISTEKEHAMIAEAALLAFLIAIFAFIRSTVISGGLTPLFENFGGFIRLNMPKIPLRALSFLLIALILAVLSFFEEAPHA